MLETGIKGYAETFTEEENTALAMGSGNLEVFATPAMIALMEQAASESVQPQLAENESSVGTLMNVKHLKATLVGKTVTAESTLTEIDGRRLVFKVAARDSSGVIGEGVHERFIVDSEKFMSRANQK